MIIRERDSLEDIEKGVNYVGKVQSVTMSADNKSKKKFKVLAEE